MKGKVSEQALQGLGGTGIMGILAVAEAPGEGDRAVEAAEFGGAFLARHDAAQLGERRLCAGGEVFVGGFEAHGGRLEFPGILREAV